MINSEVRLSKVAKELNLSIYVICNLLSEIGIRIDNNPNAKIPEKIHLGLVMLLESTKPDVIEQSYITTEKVLTDIRNKKGVPKTVFKYYNPNDYNFDALKNKFLYHSNFNDFNDPFDCLVNLLDFDIPNKKKKDELKEGTILENIKNIGICCFNRNKDSLLMWAHYADCHRGYCIEYNSMDGIDGIHPLDINYTNEFKASKFHKNPSNSIRHLIYTKSKEWEYEAEMRLISTDCVNTNARKKRFRDKDLNSIYFGAKCDPKTISTIKDIIKTHYSTSVKMFKAKICENQYKLIWEELNS